MTTTQTKKVTSSNRDGTKIELQCREDDCGNLWIQDCHANRQALGMDPNGTASAAYFGSCFVPHNGNEREAKANALLYYTGEGENFTVQ
jgi:hypothetical protein